MQEAQLNFTVYKTAFKRYDKYKATEGSENYIHASFKVIDDPNLVNPILSVFARVDKEIYHVPYNKDTGLYDIPKQAVVYPGFYIFCKLFDSQSSRVTEEIFVDVRGNGSVLRRYLTPTEEYSLELLTDMYSRIELLEGIVQEQSEVIERMKDEIQNIKDYTHTPDIPEKEPEEDGIYDDNIEIGDVSIWID